MSLHLVFTLLSGQNHLNPVFIYCKNTHRELAREWHFQTVQCFVSKPTKSICTWYKNRTKRRRQQTEKLFLCGRCQKLEDNELDLQRSENKNNWLLIIGATRTHHSDNSSHSSKEERKKERSEQRHNEADKQIKKKRKALEEAKCYFEISFFRGKDTLFYCCSPSAGEYMGHRKCHLCDVTCQQCTGPEREDCTSCPATR